MANAFEPLRMVRRNSPTRELRPKVSPAKKGRDKAKKTTMPMSRDTISVSVYKVFVEARRTQARRTATQRIPHQSWASAYKQGLGQPSNLLLSEFLGGRTVQQGSRWKVHMVWVISHIDPVELLSYHQTVNHPIEDCYVFNDWVEKQDKESSISMLKFVLV